MKKILNIATACSATLLLVACSGDTHESTKTNVTNDTKTIGSLTRDTKYLKNAVNGKSLYTYDADRANVTNCNTACQEKWPIFTGGNTANTDIEVFDTSTSHLAYKKHPMYYFASDSVPGDIKGNNVTNVWHLIHAPTGTNDTQTALSTNPLVQKYLTSANGKALYTFDNDTNSTSNCYGGCEDKWPVFYQKTITGLDSSMQVSDFTTISRDSNKSSVLKQTAYKGYPLYYYAGDTASGETKGDWVGGTWHLVEISSQKKSEGTPVVESVFTAAAATRGKTVYETNNCIGCHGSIATGRANLSQYTAAQISQKLIALQDGSSNITDGGMISTAKSLSSIQVTDVAAYIGTL